MIYFHCPVSWEHILKCSIFNGVIFTYFLPDVEEGATEAKTDDAAKEKMKDCKIIFVCGMYIKSSSYSNVTLYLYSIRLFWPISFVYGPNPFSARGTTSEQWWNGGIWLDALSRYYNARQNQILLLIVAG